MGDSETVTFNIKDDGMGGAPVGHSTRTLEFDQAGRLYISVGSVQKIDADSFRSKIRRFELGSSTSAFPLNSAYGKRGSLCGWVTKRSWIGV